MNAQTYEKLLKIQIYIGFESTEIFFCIINVDIIFLCNTYTNINKIE